MYVPSDEHKLIHTFIHSQLADKGHAYKLADFLVVNDLYRISKRVDVSSLANQTGYPHEANAWLAIGQRFLGLPGRFCPIETKAVKWYQIHFDSVKEGL
ncbi:MAG TPA: hypothetical protein DCR40_19285 [Prolixibacteraceae bacterium]|nr:hypothetical protein [Prolixibacteraceae bacterium]